MNTEMTTFLYDLYGDDPKGYLALWSAATKHTAWMPAADFEQIEERAKQINDHYDVYFGAGLQPEPLSVLKRGKAETVSLIPGFWFDADYRHPAHKSERLPSRQELWKWLEELGCFPTRIVATGHGVHLWWLFYKPLPISDMTRPSVQLIFKTFSERLRNFTEIVHGWTFDSVHDLSRVMRLPDTVNFKGDPPLRANVQTQTGPRYTVDELVRWTAELAEPVIEEEYDLRK